MSRAPRCMSMAAWRCSDARAGCGNQLGRLQAGGAWRINAVVARTAYATCKASGASRAGLLQTGFPVSVQRIRARLRLSCNAGRTGGRSGDEPIAKGFANGAAYAIGGADWPGDPGPDARLPAWTGSKNRPARGITKPPPGWGRGKKRVQ